MNKTKNVRVKENLIFSFYCKHRICSEHNLTRRHISKQHFVRASPFCFPDIALSPKMNRGRSLKSLPSKFKFQPKANIYTSIFQRPHILWIKKQWTLCYIKGSQLELNYLFNKYLHLQMLQQDPVYFNKMGSILSDKVLSQCNGKPTTVHCLQEEGLKLRLISCSIFSVAFIQSMAQLKLNICLLLTRCRQGYYKKAMGLRFFLFYSFYPFKLFKWPLNHKS